MSDQIKHECGIALIRLRKPLEYYKEKYGSWTYGIQKLYLLMEKQHNRGQDGAGVASVKIDLEPGKKYFDRYRSNLAAPIKDVFDSIRKGFAQADQSLIIDPAWAKENVPFAGELYLGHLRYGTFGNHSIDFVHPVMRANNWRSRSLVLAGNFNLTNVDELFNRLVDLGQHPKDFTDTVTILEMMGFFLDEENQMLFRKYKNEGYNNRQITKLIEDNLDIRKVLEISTKDFDGGYALAGLVGHGDAFVTRDPWGIRPANYYIDDEIVVVASERAVIQTVMNVRSQDVHQIKPGTALIIRKNGDVAIEQIRVPQTRKSCSFERIYFSRGTDKNIYLERKALGKGVVEQVLKTVDYDLKNTVFSFIPNTAETAFYGLVEGVEFYMSEQKKQQIIEANGGITQERLIEIISERPRIEKIAVKDVKMRTFITQDQDRDDMVAHVYDITYGTINQGVDNLVIIDDSIVRGTTLRQSILRMLDRLKPKKIVVVSSAPQIRYPDCYGIDMTKMGDFIAFTAAIQLLKDKGKADIIEDVYKRCKAQQYLPKEEIVNHVKDIYRPFTDEQISEKIAEMLRPKEMKAELEIIYQTIEGLHQACPNDLGDWYFTGNYPTDGGNRVVNTAFINYIEGKNQRAY